MAGISLSDFGLGINVGGLVDKLLTFGIIILTILIVSAMVFFFMKWKNKKKKPQKKISWWEDLHGSLIPTTTENAEEIIIPGTRLRVFYIKARDMWLPRFTRGVTKDIFFVAITPKRELVNFTLTSIGEDMEKAGLNYDHTDMIWASENIRDFIKRNYRDKSTPWWKAYQGVITTGIYIVLLTVSFVVILYFMREMMVEMKSILNGIEQLLKQMDACYPKGSGITTATELLPLMFIKSIKGIK